MSREEEEAYQSLSEEEKETADKPIKPLKLVIMSATLRVEDFTQNQRLFPNPPPVLRVDARQYPVTVHFNKRTELDNYVDEAYKKVIKIHKKLPEGGVLVFLTGQREILQLCRKLSRAYSVAARDKKAAELKSSRAFRAQRRQPTEKSSKDDFLREHDDIEEEADLEDAQVYGNEVDEDPAYDLEEEEQNSDQEDDEEMNEELAVPYLHVLPLYSLLPNDEQMKVFDTPPENHRLIVVATNVAETSLTIPGINPVDLQGERGSTCRSCRSYGPGHCYRLYSSAVYDTEFQKFSSPEILCQPIDDLVLQMKAMGIHNVLQFPQFPFPTPPDRQAVKNALATLVNLGAVSPGDDESITGLGRALVKFPKLNVVEYTIAIVAGLSGHSPFIHALDRREKEKSEEENADKRKEWREAEEMRKHAQWIDQESDVLSLLRAAGAYAYTGGSSQFCKDNHLHEKTMQNMLKLPQMPPPDLETQVVLRQIVAAGFLDQVAKRVPAGTITEGTKIERNCAYIAATGQVKEPVYIHPHSSVFTPNPSKLPQFVVYQHIMRTTRAYMKMVTAIEPEWLAGIGKNTPLCKYAPPLAEPAPFYHAELDEVQCYAKAQYGIHHGLYRPCASRIRTKMHRTRRTDGRQVSVVRQVPAGWPGCHQFVPFSSALKEPSHTLIRKKFDKKIQLLVAKLQQNRVASRRALVDKPLGSRSAAPLAALPHALASVAGLTSSSSPSRSVSRSSPTVATKPGTSPHSHHIKSKPSPPVWHETQRFKPDTRGIVLPLFDDIALLGFSLILELRRLQDPSVTFYDVCEQAANAAIESRQLFCVDLDHCYHKFRSFDIKVLAVVYSEFQEVMLLDADTLFFQNNQVQEHGTLFFNDRISYELSYLAKRMSSEHENTSATEERAGLDFSFQPSEFLLNSHVWSLRSGHQMDSSLMLWNKARQPKATVILASFVSLNGLPTVPSYGDKELYWLACELAETAYEFSDFAAGTVGWELLAEGRHKDGVLCGDALQHYPVQKNPAKGPGADVEPLYMNSDNILEWGRDSRRLYRTAARPAEFYPGSFTERKLLQTCPFDVTTMEIAPMEAMLLAQRQQLYDVVAG
ncbi:P-loop containing nucleoside triphosphate hydrolase [Phytophthora cactorum]|nr:P-loop containing nucleoside triphosphate hydrolase [Phytophthora cactorum]